MKNDPKRTSRLMIYTQYLENYAIDASGNLKDTPYWKAKGGSEYFVMLPVNQKNVSSADCEEIVARLQSRVETKNDYCQEYVINWSIHPGDFVTDYEEFCQDLRFNAESRDDLDLTRFNTFRIPR